MGGFDDIKGAIREKIEPNLLNNMKKDVAKEEIILFVSFDLVNSSKYKTRNYTNWFPILITINEKIKNYMKQNIPNSQLWRSIGDEVIFIVNITSNCELRNAVKEIFKILNNIIKEIKDGSIVSNVLNKEEVNVFKSQNVLSLKAGAWIAPVYKTSDLTKQNANIHNLMYMYNHDEGLPTYEFQGNDIDTGFRLLEHTRKRRLVISIELAYLLAKDQYTDPKINIITYRKLKGIWDEKLYPVIWYHDDECAKCKIEDSFLYDEYYNDDLTKEFIDGDYANIINSKENTSFQKLDKIIKDNNMMYKVNLLESELQDFNKSKKLIQGNKLLEVHCVAVCYNTKKKKVLILKRNKNLNNYPDKWEFGCSTISNGMTFEENLKKDYKNFADININIKYPFKSYSFEDKDKKIIPGIRFLAEFDDERKPEELKLNDKYVEARYVDFKEYSENEYKNVSIDYDDFCEILQFIFEKYGGLIH